MSEKENEIGLLDLLIIVSENIRLLMLASLGAGLIAWGITSAMPQSYVSRAILVLPASAQALEGVATAMVSPLVLDPLIDSSKLSDGDSIEVARQKLAGQIKPSIGKDGLLRLDVTAATPVQAQLLANAVIDGWLKSAALSEQARTDLLRQLSYAKDELDSTRRLLSSLLHSLAGQKGDGLRKTLMRSDAAATLAALGELEARYSKEVQEITRSLLSRDVVKQPPTLPVESVSPRRGLISALSALIAGMAMVLYALGRQAWRCAARDPQTATKLARLRAALRLR